MAVKSHDLSICELHVVSSVLPDGRSSGRIVVAHASGAIIHTACRQHSSHLSGSSLLAPTDGGTTWSDGAESVAVGGDVLSWQHVGAHLSKVASLKLAIFVCPAGGHTGSNVV